jgi:hypothetical protein
MTSAMTSLRRTRFILCSSCHALGRHRLPAVLTSRGGHRHRRGDPHEALSYE